MNILTDLIVSNAYSFIFGLTIGIVIGVIGFAGWAVLEAIRMSESHADVE